MGGACKANLEVEGEGEEEKMMRRADPGAVRQDTKEVD